MTSPFRKGPLWRYVFRIRPLLQDNYTVAVRLHYSEKVHFACYYSEYVLSFFVVVSHPPLGRNDERYSEMVPFGGYYSEYVLSS